MPRKCLYDVVSSNQIRETIDKEAKTRERWFKLNKGIIWCNSIGPIHERIICICEDRQKLARKLENQYALSVKTLSSSTRPANCA